MSLRDEKLNFPLAPFNPPLSPFNKGGLRRIWGTGGLVRIAYTVILFLIVLIVIPSSVNAKTFTDDIGRKIDISKRPHRIISLAPSITEILFYLNLGDKIVGVTDFCNYPKEARKKPSIGWLISPDIEKIISLKPDLVFATAEGNRPDIVDTLDRVNIKVYVLDPHNLEDILRQIISIGKITGHEETAIEKVRGLTLRIEAIKKRVQTGNGVRTMVLYLVSVEPIISAGPGSFIYDIIKIAGGENVAPQSPARYPRIEMEEIVQRDPEVIIAPQDIIGSIRSWKNRWGRISAVRNNKIYPIDPDIISRPGPRIVDGLEYIYGYIHEIKM